jgi:inner membrane protein
MDPVTHTMLGATLAQTGLKKRTALGTATLVIGANLPDLDVLAYFWGGETAVWFRRGLTHGVLALVVLPFVLTGLILLWDRLVRRRARAVQGPVVPAQVLWLAVLAVATHPLLDFLNSYGMRWLAPFSWTWFYGDTLFIVDPWVWMMLAAGLWLGRKGVRGPKLAIGLASLYVVLMAASNVAARSVVKRTLDAEGVMVEHIMTAPLAVTPFERWVVVQDSSGYRVGMFNWLARPAFKLSGLPYDGDLSGDVALQAAQEPEVQRFLSWARFPYYVVGERQWGYELHIGDARYGVDPFGSWASTSVSLRRQTP